MTRRALLGAAFAAPFLSAADTLPIKRAVEFNMLPKSLTILDAFQLAKDCGFEEIECPTTPEKSKAQEMLDASQKTALRIHSVMNQAHWTYPLSSPDPAVVEKSMEGMRASFENAKLWHADTVLLVPAVVTAEVTYAEAWERSQQLSIVGWVYSLKDGLIRDLQMSVGSPGESSTAVQTALDALKSRALG